MENTNTNIETVVEQGQEEQQEKTYTFEEVQAMLQKESDRRVTSALKKAQKDFDKKLSLSKLDESERLTAEKDDRIAELEKQLELFETEKNRSELKSVLSARGLSAEFADLILIDDDIEESQARIDALDRLFKQAVAAEVKQRLASNKPVVGTGNIEEMNAETFKNMSLLERNNLYKTDPEKYRKLSGMS